MELVNIGQQPVTVPQMVIGANPVREPARLVPLRGDGLREGAERLDEEPIQIGLEREIDDRRHGVDAAFPGHLVDRGIRRGRSDQDPHPIVVGSARVGSGALGIGRAERGRSEPLPDSGVP